MLAALALVGCASDARPPGYNDALREIRYQRTEHDARYRRLVHRDLRRNFSRVLKDCRYQALDTRPATLLFRLGAGGEALESFRYPPGEFTDCVYQAVAAFDFPPPPQPNYWFGVFVRDCPLGGGSSECPQIVP